MMANIAQTAAGVAIGHVASHAIIGAMSGGGDKEEGECYHSNHSGYIAQHDSQTILRNTTISAQCRCTVPFLITTLPYPLLTINRTQTSSGPSRATAATVPAPAATVPAPAATTILCSTSSPVCTPDG